MPKIEDDWYYGYVPMRLDYNAWSKFITGELDYEQDSTYCIDNYNRCFVREGNADCEGETKISDKRFGKESFSE